MVASSGGGNGEGRRDRDSQDEGPSDSGTELTDNQRERAAGCSDEQRTDDARAAL
jgi:hypothetical protein